MDGFVHNAEGYAKSCAPVLPALAPALSPISPVSARWATTIRLPELLLLHGFAVRAVRSVVLARGKQEHRQPHRDLHRRHNPGSGLRSGQRRSSSAAEHANIFQELDQANVSWKIYYTVTDELCLDGDDCRASANANYPATDFEYLSYSYQVSVSKIQPAQPVLRPRSHPAWLGDATNSFCIDPNHIAPLSTYFSDLTNGTLPSFAFIEAGYGNNDEHPGSGQSILAGQAQVANIVNSLMASPEWKDSVFFLSYDEGGGPYDHVPPVPGQSNDEYRCFARDDSGYLAPLR